MRRPKPRLPSHTTAVAYIALFVALGGTSFAALKVGSPQISDNSVRSRDVRNNDLRGKDVRNGTLTGGDLARGRVGGREIDEASLGAVPRALDATRIGGVTSDQLKLRCPAGTAAKAGACLETAVSIAPFATAATACKQKGRRLPLYAELQQLAEDGGGVSPAGEWSASVFESRAVAGQLDTVLVTSSGGATFARAGGATARPFRCAAMPAN